MLNFVDELMFFSACNQVILIAKAFGQVVTEQVLPGSTNAWHESRLRFEVIFQHLKPHVVPRPPMAKPQPKALVRRPWLTTPERPIRVPADSPRPRAEGFPQKTGGEGRAGTVRHDACAQ